MKDYKNAIDKTIDEAKVTLGDLITGIATIANGANIYDIQLTLKRGVEEHAPKYVSFSYDYDAGFYIDTDGVSWEFGKDTRAFEKVATELLYAIKDGRARLEKKTIFRLITLNRKLIIVDKNKK